MTAVEFLAFPVNRPPAMASEINSGGLLERRFKMIMSKKINRVNSGWLRVCMLLCAVVIIPLGLVYGQNYDAVERRLGKAVKKGELSLKDANIMMDALRKTSKDRLKMVSKRLKIAVAKGDMTEEEAWAKWRGIEKAEISERLKAAVAKGEMTGKGSIDDHHRAVGIKIRKAVARGEITEEEGKAKMIAFKKRKAGKMKGDDYLEKVWAKLQAEVKAGNITPEEAEAKMRGIKKKKAGTTK